MEVYVCTNNVDSTELGVSEFEEIHKCRPFGNIRLNGIDSVKFKFVDISPYYMRSELRMQKEDEPFHKEQLCDL